MASPPTSRSGHSDTLRLRIKSISVPFQQLFSKPGLGAMHKHPQVLPVDAETAANLVLVSLVIKDHPKQFTVFSRQVLEHFSDLAFPLFVHQSPLGAGAVVKNLELIGRTVVGSRFGAVDLAEQILAYRIDKSPQPLGAFQSVLPAQRRQHAQERLLAEVFDQVHGTHAGA